MLTGTYKPTYGEIYVDGNAISQGGLSLQNQFGVCAQFDYFWPHFTPRQMFDVIGAFKGYPLDTVRSEMERLMGVFQMQAYLDRSSDSAVRA